MLYKKSSTGKIETWEIKYTDDWRTDGSTMLRVIYGELDGKKTIKDTIIKTGKNIGKSNETTSFQQAEKEAKAKYDKKLKEGYVTSLKAAELGEIDDLIEGGINPMLAHGYQDNKHKIKYPVHVQPKLNGHRCIAFKKDGVVHLWSRKRHRIITCHEIVQEVNKVMSGEPDGSFLDGELYKHGWTLQRISSAAKKRNGDTPLLEFHVYDCGLVGTEHNFKQRNSHLAELEFNSFFTSLVGVKTSYVGDESMLKPMHDKAVQEGNEGLIIRQLNNPYEYKRSYSLLKYKEMQDAEFDIASVFEGKDNTVIFRVIMPNTFDAFTGEYQGCNVTMSGSRKANQKYLNDESLWVGKKLTVQFQSYTPDGSLEFPVGLQIRDDL
jgi:DNA ligase-1